MARAEIILLSAMLAALSLPHVRTSEAAAQQNDDSMDIVTEMASQQMQTSQTEEEMHSNATLGSTEHHPLVIVTSEEIPSERTIERRMGMQQQVTHGVGYNTHLDPHYYQRRDMGRYYDCALQGPWKPIHGHAQHHVAHEQGAEDGGGHYRQQPAHPLPHQGKHKQNGNGQNNYVEEWDQQLKNVLHGQQEPSGSGHYRNLPSGNGQGGGGRGYNQGGGDSGGDYAGNDAGPSGYGHSSELVSNVNGHQGAPQHSVPIHSYVPTIFDHENWHQWFFTDDYGGPSGHDEDGLSQDHDEMAAYHNSEDNVGDGRYTQAVFGLRENPKGHQGQGNVQAEEVSEELPDGEGEQGAYAHTGESGEFPQEGQQGEDQSVPYEGTSGEGSQGTLEAQDQSRPVNDEGESGEGQSATGEHKLPCDEDEEEGAADEAAGEGDVNVSVDEDLSFMEIMYPPPPPQTAHETSAPGSAGDESQQEHSEGAEEAPAHQPQMPIQHAYGASGYDSPPPKCPYADHGNAVTANSMHGASHGAGEHPSLPQEMLPPNAALFIRPPVKHYEVYENQDEGLKEGGSVEAEHRPPHGQQALSANYGGEETQEPVFGHRIPVNQGVLQIYGNPMPSVGGIQHGYREPIVPHNSIAEESSYPEEQQIGNAILKPPPLFIRDNFVKGNGLKVIVEGRRKRRPLSWPGLPSGRFPVNMPVPLMMRPRRIVRRPTARMMLTLS